MAYAPKPSFSKEQPDQVVIQNRVPKQEQSDFTGTMPGSSGGGNTTFRLVNPTGGNAATTTSSNANPYPTGYSSGMPSGLDTQSGPGASYQPTAGTGTGRVTMAGNAQTNPGLISDTSPWQYRPSTGTGGTWAGQDPTTGRPVYTANDFRYNPSQSAGFSSYANSAPSLMYNVGGSYSTSGGGGGGQTDGGPTGGGGGIQPTIPNEGGQPGQPDPNTPPYHPPGGGGGGGGGNNNPPPNNPPPAGPPPSNNPTGGYQNITGQQMQNYASQAPPGVDPSAWRMYLATPLGQQYMASHPPTSGGTPGGPGMGYNPNPVRGQPTPGLSNSQLTVGNPNGMTQQSDSQRTGTPRPNPNGYQRGWRGDTGNYNMNGYSYPLMSGNPPSGGGNAMAGGNYATYSTGQRDGGPSPQYPPLGNGGGYGPPGPDYQPPVKGGGTTTIGVNNGPGIRGTGQPGRPGYSSPNMDWRSRIGYYHPATGAPIDPNSPYAQPGYANPQGIWNPNAPPPWLGGRGYTGGGGAGGSTPPSGNPMVQDPDPQGPTGGMSNAMYQISPQQNLAQMQALWNYYAQQGYRPAAQGTMPQNPIQNPTWGAPWPGWGGDSARPPMQEIDGPDLRARPPYQGPTR